MNKTDLKAFSIAARLELLARVRERAAFYGITEEKCKSNAVDVSASFQKLDGSLLSTRETQQRFALLSRIRSSGFEQVMEEVAYTWFNRFIALKYMEEHQLLPVDIRVLPEQPGALPQMVKEAQHVELDGVSLANVAQMLDENRTDELYKAQLIALCNQLSGSLPQMFEPIEDYTELLFPENLLRSESVLGMMAKLNNQKDANWEDIQVIGWLYQYYNTELKQETFDLLKKNVKITKERIGAATQLFTPEWIVRYMVENSLGRLWLEGHEDKNLRMKWRYYLDEAKQESEVEQQLAIIRKGRKDIQPEQIKILDPCMGSGHILVYAFDVLMDIYRSVGYTDRDAVESIIKNNLYGLDVDDRAAQLAYFALMMKACEYDRRFLRRENQPHVYSIQASQRISLAVFQCYGDLKEKAIALYTAFCDAKDYGSIIQAPLVCEEINQIKNRSKQILVETDDGLRLDEAAMNRSAVATIDALMPKTEILAQLYDVVVTNPPYMGSSGMNDKISKYVKDNYPDSKSDLFAVFMERINTMLKQYCYQAMITQHSWMFLSSFEKLRAKLQQNETINMVHLGARAFEEIGGEVVQTTAFVFQNNHIDGYTGTYCRLVEPATQRGKEDMFLSEENRFTAQQDNFTKIPGAPVAYWANERLIRAFESKTLYEDSESPSQNVTGNNSRFVRKHWELDSNFIGGYDSWIFYCKGGGYRKWWGNLEDVVNWTPEARRIYQFGDGTHASQIINKEYWYRKGITWGLITSNSPSFRVMPEGATYDKGGSTIIVNDEIYNFALGLLNSKVYLVIVMMFNPTLNFQVKDVRSMPLILKQTDEINSIVVSLVNTSREDWNSFETSWEFDRHPLI